MLSHNLCTVMKIPHDPVALEEHFKDDDEGPVSNQGYMPYLNKFILDKVPHRSWWPRTLAAAFSSTCYVSATDSSVMVMMSLMGDGGDCSSVSEAPVFPFVTSECLEFF